MPSMAFLKFSLASSKQSPWAKNPDASGTLAISIRQCLVKNISVSLIERVIAGTVKKRRLPGSVFGWNFTYRGYGVTFRGF